MRNINIRVISKSIQLLRFLLSVIVGLTLAFWLVTKEGNSIVFMSTFTLGLLLVLWITKTLPSGNMQLIASVEGLQIVWIDQILFKNKSNHSFEWSDIKYYSCIYNAHLSEFRLDLVDGRRFSVSFDSVQTDFWDFYLKFKELAIQACEKDQSVEIYEKDDSLKERVEEWVLFSCGLAVLLVCAYVAFFKSEGDQNWLQLVAGIILGLSLTWSKLKLIWMPKDRGQRQYLDLTIEKMYWV